MYVMISKQDFQNLPMMSSNPSSEFRFSLKRKIKKIGGQLPAFRVRADVQTWSATRSTFYVDPVLNLFGQFF